MFGWFHKMTGIIGILLKPLPLLLGCFMKCPNIFRLHNMMGFSVAAVLCYTAPQTSDIFGK